METAHSNQATPKYLGYVYQILIAIEKCFEASPNETIWIECFGDVYNGHTFTEVKHHFGKHNLVSNSKDFWNTLKNLVVEDSSQFVKMVLHTTSYIPEDSIFYNWNALSGEDRFNLVNNHTPNNTINELYKTIMSECSNQELTDILSRFSIEASRVEIKDQWGKLLERNLRTVDINYREHILHYIYSYVNKRAIDNRHYWNVNINDFDAAIQYQVNRWGGDKIPFPVDSTEHKLDESAHFTFLIEYKQMGIKGVDRGIALNEYFQAKKSEEDLVDLKPDVMSEIIDQYAVDVVSKASGFKREFAYDVQEEDLDNPIANKASRTAYFRFYNSSVLEIPEVSDTKAYFMRGKVHEAVSDNKYTWTYNIEDLDL
ncbi:hypothetical protein [Vibrio splendidus]|uniref:hypothetical protein n=1 Tax=Vibrio splendidus TaxID=29497 RepID=UPI000D3A0D73|nr:hypothetical protein [Vibrio splendidus]PTO69302.1 hypothetical protein CWN81_18060 [Vibrio splendidus]